MCFKVILMRSLFIFFATIIMFIPFVTIGDDFKTFGEACTKIGFASKSKAHANCVLTLGHL